MVHNRNNRYTTPGGRAIPIAQATLHVYGPGNVVLPTDCGVNGSALTIEECTFNHIPFSNPAELWVGRKRPILEHLKQHNTFLFAAIFSNIHPCHRDRLPQLDACRSYAAAPSVK